MVFVFLAENLFSTKKKTLRGLGGLFLRELYNETRLTVCELGGHNWGHQKEQINQDLFFISRVFSPFHERR